MYIHPSEITSIPMKLSNLIYYIWGKNKIPMEKPLSETFKAKGRWNMVPHILLKLATYVIIVNETPSIHSNENLLGKHFHLPSLQPPLDCHYKSVLSKGGV